MGLYEDDFQVYLKTTNEKEVLGKFVLKVITNNCYQSVLDIGAGNGEISIPISKKVKRFLAIEHIEEFSNKLKWNGIEVISKTFPTNLNEKFDLVLCSYSVPYERKDYEPFLSDAFEAIKRQGTLLRS